MAEAGLDLSDSTSSTHMAVLSEPVPAVVGTAISGLSWRPGRAAPADRLVDVVHQAAPSSVVSRFTALAVSMDDPPPTATNPSHGPCSRA